MLTFAQVITQKESVKNIVQTSF